MADSSSGSSRTRLYLFALVGAVVVGYLLLSSGTPSDRSGNQAESIPTAEHATPQDPSAGEPAEADGQAGVQSADGIVDEIDEARTDLSEGRATDDAASPDEARDQALAEVWAAIEARPDPKATEDFRARVAAPPPPTPDWVTQAIEQGPPPVPVEIADQIALGQPQVPAEMQEAVERTLREGPPPTPPELERAIENAPN